MKKKLSILFALITISMAGIIYFQIDWVLKTYTLEFRKINSTAGALLNSAILRLHADHNEATRKLLVDQLTPVADSVDVNFTGDINSSLWEGRKKLASNSDSLYITLNNRRSSLVPKEHIWSRYSYDRGRVRITFPEIAYSRSGRGPISPSSQASLVKIEKTIQRIIPSASNTCDPKYSKKDSALLTRYFKELLIQKDMADLAEVADLVFYCGTKPPISIVYGTDIQEYLPAGIAGYTGTRRWVHAYFQNYSNHILSGMIGNVLLSALLIAITIVSFIYLLKLVMRQKRMSEMKDDFINNMTHELKTPIATISAAVESMQSFNVLQDKAKTERYLETSRRELLRLNSLVTKVLNMAAYEKKEIDLVINNLDIKTLIEDIIHTEKLKTDKTVNFTVNVQQDMHVQADPIHFRNALANLVDNAVKYSQEPADVMISCYTDQTGACFQVKDNGRGIPVPELTRIFDKFYRIPTGNTHNVKGTGLGLSYVRYVVEMHRGTVTVKSELTKGSEFTITLALA